MPDDLYAALLAEAQQRLALARDAAGAETEVATNYPTSTRWRPGINRHAWPEHAALYGTLTGKALATLLAADVELIQGHEHRPVWNGGEILYSICEYCGVISLDERWCWHIRNRFAAYGIEVPEVAKAAPAAPEPITNVRPCMHCGATLVIRNGILQDCPRCGRS